MLKPLSQKTLEKKYAELGLPKEKTDMLHKYFLCFSNLYGVITIKDAWEIFKRYEGTAVHKKDFVAFSGIVQREAGHTYSIYELKEIFTVEETNDPLMRMIVNNSLVSFGYNKFCLVYATVDRQNDKSFYLPGKQILETFTEDRFYLTPCGKKMKSFIENLKTNGISKDLFGKPNGELTDLNGEPIKGKLLSKCIFYTQYEKMDLEYFKDESKKKKLRELFNKTASEKILSRIREYILTGGIIEDESPIDEIGSLADVLDKDYGVILSEQQGMKFADLFMKLNNGSNLWLNRGWTPDDLFQQLSPQKPDSILIGPNMKKMFESGEMDRAEFEKQLAKLGITLKD